MLDNDKADCLVAGAITSTADVIKSSMIKKIKILSLTHRHHFHAGCASILIIL